MASKKNGLACFCCGADITAPQWFKGNAYGYTCITKVSDQKRSKNNNIVYVKADSVVVDIENRQAIATLNGVEYVAPLKMMDGVICTPDNMIALDQGYIKLTTMGVGTGKAQVLVCVWRGHRFTNENGNITVYDKKDQPLN